MTTRSPRQARYLTTQAKEDGLEYIHNSVGYNYRMNNVLAAIGLAQLENLDERVAIKRANFARYQEALGPSRLLDQPAWSDRTAGSTPSCATTPT